MGNRIDAEDYRLLKIVARNIQEIRTAKNITIEEISEKTKIKERYLKRIEKGLAMRMTLTHLLLIAEALNVDVKILVKIKTP